MKKETVNLIKLHNSIRNECLADLIYFNNKDTSLCNKCLCFPVFWGPGLGVVDIRLLPGLVIFVFCSDPPSVYCGKEDLERKYWKSKK